MARGKRTGLVLVIGLTLLAACSSASSHADKAGGEGVLVLSMADSGAQLELDSFVSEVERLSDGAMRIAPRTAWRQRQQDFENGLIGDVRAGNVELGWVGSRAWDSVGINAFRALHAPFLIDSYELQERVVQSALVDEMLQRLEPLGLVGLGVLPGPLRKPLGITRRLVRPEDFQGLTIGVQQSRVADQTIRALGGRPVWFPPRGTIGRFQGVEQQIDSIQGNRYDATGRYLTVNVTFWPRPLVLFANQKVFNDLTGAQQRILRKAVANAIPAATPRLRQSERESGAILCRRRSLRIVTATPDNVAALRGAVRPVYDALKRDPQTRRLLAAIAAMRKGISAEPPLGCDTSEAPAASSGPLDGVYQVTTTRRDLLAAGIPLGDVVPENYGAWTYVIDRGRLAFTQESKEACTWGYGKLTVTGHQASWLIEDGGGITPNNAVNKPGEIFGFGWSLYHETLTLTSVAGAISPENFRLKPWHRVSKTPSRRFLSNRCPPPAAALPG